MHKWRIERKREPAQTKVMWGDWRGEYVERGAALKIDDFRRTIPLIPHIAIPRNKGQEQTFLYPDSLMAHPLVLGVAGRTTFDYSGGVYSGLVQTLEQNEHYFIQTEDLERLQRAWSTLLGYWPDASVFSLPMPFGLYGLPTPLSTAFEHTVDGLESDFISRSGAAMANVDGAAYNLANESLQRITDEIRRLKHLGSLFHFSDTPSIE